MDAKQSGKFTERLSLLMVIVASIGAFLVLLDPKISLSFQGQTIAFGAGGFSADLKGAVISLILIGGFSAVKEYWLGSSFGSSEKGEAIARIAEALPVIAAAVPSEVPPPLKGNST